jgi:hypothetical protein
MSLLSENTQPEALRVLLRTLPFFGQLEKMRMSAADAFAARQAENLLRGIIESNTETTEEL